MNKSCLDCEYSDFSIYSGEGYCGWELPSDSPTWLLEYQLKAIEADKINKNRPYVDCPAWKEEP